MVQSNFTSEKEENAEKNFENIKEAIKGLFDLLNISLSDEELYLKAGQENLEGLYQNLIELLLNDYGLRKLVKKIRNSEIELDIALKELSIRKEF